MPKAFKDQINPIGLERQRSFYTNGMGGTSEKIPTAFPALKAKAKSRLSAEAFAYIAGGAGAESTMSRNLSAFHEWKILPRMLKDVSQRNTSIELFGRKLPAPILTAPVGVLELAHPKADLAVAKATSNLGMPMIFSNQASFSMEECSKVMGDSPRWFQLYWSKSNDLVKSLVQRAEKVGCDAIVVTLDTTMLGWRNRDLDLAYLPFLQGKGIAQYVNDPVFNALLDQPDDPNAQAINPRISLKLISNVIGLMNRYPGGFFSNLSSKRPLRAVRQFINIYSRPSLTWEDLDFLRTVTDLPILLKGIIHPDDAAKAVEVGIDGLVVSNHGGRQIDGGASTIEMLPQIADRVKGRIPLIMDSGIRNGSDIFKALALGATAVCVGRPYAYGLAIDGAAGVQTVLENIWAEFELTMGLAGCTNINEINRDCLVK